MHKQCVHITTSQHRTFLGKEQSSTATLQLHYSNHWTVSNWSIYQTFLDSKQFKCLSLTKRYSNQWTISNWSIYLTFHGSKQQRIYLQYAIIISVALYGVKDKGNGTKPAPSIPGVHGAINFTIPNTMQPCHCTIQY